MLALAESGRVRSSRPLRVLLVLSAAVALCVGVIFAVRLVAVRQLYAMGAGQGLRMVERLANAEQDYYRTRRTYLAAGPAPAVIPGQRRAHVGHEPAFSALGFEWEGGTFHQSWVVTNDKSGAEAHAHVIVRSDIDGDGVIAEYRIELFGGRSSAVMKPPPGTY